MPPTHTLVLEGVSHRWPRQASGLTVADFSIAQGERVFLRGPSGSGKSTLLNLIAGTLQPGRGRIELAGHDMTRLSASRRDRHRADSLGVIFQQFNLLPFLDVIGNVTLPCRFSARRAASATRTHGSPTGAACFLLDALGLPTQAQGSVTVAELSVGQQQRVAVARALIGEPSLVLADEPTSALDADARDAFIRLLTQECERTGAAVLFVSHDRALARHFHRAVEISEIAVAPVPTQAA